jgi:hypothetical protein
MKGIREWLNTSAGKAASIGSAVLLILVALYMIKSSATSDAAALSREGLFVDAKTGKGFNYTFQVGDTIPVTAPSGEKNGFPAELCYWTKDGKISTNPTYVLLNRYLNKPEPTFCPDCGRLVRLRNPSPVEGKPPPVQSEFKGRIEEEPTR